MIFWIILSYLLVGLALVAWTNALAADEISHNDDLRLWLFWPASIASMIGFAIWTRRKQ